MWLVIVLLVKFTSMKGLMMFEYPQEAFCVMRAVTLTKEPELLLQPVTLGDTGKILDKHN